MPAVRTPVVALVVGEPGSLQLLLEFGGRRRQRAPHQAGAHRRLLPLRHRHVRLHLLLRQRRVDRAGDAGAVVDALRRDELRDELLHCRPWHLALDQLDGRFLQHAGRLAIRVAEDLAADRIGGRARDAGQLERLRVGHREMADGLHEDRVVRRGSVQLLARQVALLAQLRRRMPATGLHPLARRHVLRLDELRDDRLRFGNGLGADHLGSRLGASGPDHVGVAVHQARDHRAALEIDDTRARRDEPANVFGAADADELAVLDRDSLSDRKRPIDGHDLAIDVHRVGIAGPGQGAAHQRAGEQDRWQRRQQSEALDESDLEYM